MAKRGKNGLTREQAGELYQDLQKTMAKMLKNEADYYNSKGMKAPTNPVNFNSATTAARPPFSMKQYSATNKFSRNTRNAGAYTAICFMLTIAFTKVILSGMEAAGFASIEPVEASVVRRESSPASSQPRFSKEELQVLTSLDARRSELEDRSQRLNEREQDIAKKEREFATRLTELREINDRLVADREKNDRKRSGQLDQLANVYGSMAPQEAAHLIEQLDITIALSLLERMPEKRIGQILALMAPEKALSITKMLSDKAK